MGSAMAMCLAPLDSVERIEICARSPASAAAARADVLSAFPECWNRLRDVDHLDGTYDIVIVTAGIQPSLGTPREILYRTNLAIAKWFVRSVVLEFGLVVLVGTPVDELTQTFATRIMSDSRRAVGFGGELDKSRLVSLLMEQMGAGEWTPGVTAVVGEHGERAIPVFPGSADYEVMRDLVRATLKDIITATARARNLASGVQLVRLVRALMGESQWASQCVSSIVERYGMALTWPCIVGGDGILGHDAIEIEGGARSDLEELVENRKMEMREMMA